MIWRFRMVGDPSRLVAAVGRASLSVWETARSTRPFRLDHPGHLRLMPVLRYSTLCNTCGLPRGLVPESENWAMVGISLPTSMVADSPL